MIWILAWFAGFMLTSALYLRRRMEQTRIWCEDCERFDTPDSGSACSKEKFAYTDYTHNKSGVYRTRGHRRRTVKIGDYPRQTGDALAAMVRGLFWPVSLLPILLMLATPRTPTEVKARLRAQEKRSAELEAEIERLAKQQDGGK
jgi:hypothetical protein